MAVALKSNVRFDRNQLRIAFGDSVHAVIETFAQELLDFYAAGAPRASGDFADGLTAELRGKGGFRTDFVISSSVPYGVWVERRHYPIRATLNPVIREFVRAAAKSVDFDALAKRTGQDVKRLRRTFHARAGYTGRARGPRRLSRGARRRRAGGQFRRGALRQGARLVR